MRKQWLVLAAVLVAVAGVTWFEGAPARKRKAEWAATVEANRLKMAAARKALEAKCGPEPKMCAVGLKTLPCAVKERLTATLKDPASLSLQEACEARDDVDGWVASCSYRARNSYGAMTVERHLFKIRDEHIVYMD